MDIYINDRLTRVPLGCVNLAQLLAAKGYISLHLSITVDHREVPLFAAADIPLTPHMHITIR